MPDRMIIFMNRLRIFLSKVFKKFSMPQWLVFSIDSLAVYVTFYLAYLLRYNLIYSEVDTGRALFQGIMVILVYLLFFILYRTYQGRIRHTNMRDTFNLFLTTTSAVSLLLIISVISRTYQNNIFFHLPYSILLIHYGMITVILFFERMIVKMAFEFITASTLNKKNILIYGAGSMGVTIKEVIDNDKTHNYRIAGFLDDDKKAQRKQIGGVDVFSPRKINASFVEKNNIHILLFAINNMPPSRKSKAIKRALELGLELLETPSLDKWLNGVIRVKQLRKVRPRDLLGREQIRLDMAKIQNELDGKTVMVTGAAGSIGSEIVRQLVKFDIRQLLLIDQAETPMFYLNNELSVNYNLSSVRLVLADVTNAEKMHRCFQQYRPDIIFHAAAYKHVPIMEEHPQEAFRVNVGGTKILTDLALEFKVEKFVMISSDKAVNPTNVMGATKRICELYVQSIAQKSNSPTQFVTTRFGNVIGSNGSVIPLFTKQLEEGGPITITHPEVTRFFMTIPEACQLVLEAGFMGKGGEIYVFDMGKPIKIVDLANNMIKLSGLVPDKDIKITYTGLRPGEKLYEELLADKESTIPTHHPKIMIARVREADAILTISRINEVLERVYQYSNREMVELFKTMVPEYNSSNKAYNGSVGSSIKG